MDELRVAVGSTRPAKVRAAKEAFEQVSPFLIGKEMALRLETHSVSSDVPDMPTSLEELMRGAKNRARNLQELGIEADFYVGLEGGFFRQAAGEGEPVQTFLQGWAFVTNGTIGSFGASYCAPVPEALARAVYVDHLELGQIIDEFSGARNVRDNQGAFGIFTLNFLSRADSFRTALIAALAPFYNALPYTKHLH
ncbi:MAG: DUF84 family protein [Calditrichaeota bacterium]|nr:DUF84 family protein [Calditrichota bacterium]